MSRKVGIARVHKSAPAWNVLLCACCRALTFGCVCGGYAWLCWLHCDSNALAAVAGVRTGMAASAAIATTMQHTRHMQLQQPLLHPHLLLSSLHMQAGCQSCNALRVWC